MFFTVHEQNHHISTSNLKSDVIITFLETDFFLDMGNSAICIHYSTQL